jgi:hypothetical protein
MPGQMGSAQRDLKGIRLRAIAPGIPIPQGLDQFRGVLLLRATGMTCAWLPGSAHAYSVDSGGIKDSSKVLQ